MPTGPAVIGVAASDGGLLRPEVVGLPAYDPGADPDDDPTRSGSTRVLTLSSNESPYGPSAAAVGAVRLRVTSDLARYPDPRGKRLTGALAARLDVPPRRIVLGNGSENILELLCHAVLRPGDVVTTQAPGFSLHEIFPRLMGARVVKVAPGPDFAFDSAGWRDALATGPRMVFIANPCNPTGVMLDRNELDVIINSAPRDALLVLDEAYHEYARGHPGFPDGFGTLCGLARPWIVLRTFSKAYGLAGLRVGYGVASDEALVDALHRVRTPYNVNQLAQHAAVAALSDDDHVWTVVGRTKSERGRVRALLVEAGLRVAPSVANFLFIDTGRPATTVAAALFRAGIIVKPWREPGWERYIRASLALPPDNDRFVAELRRVCA